MARPVAGDSVMDRSFNEGVVKSDAGGNGASVNVLWRNARRPQPVFIGSLAAVEIPCWDQICRGDFIRDSRGFTGYVKVVYNNAQVRVRFQDAGSGHEELRQVNDLRDLFWDDRQAAYDSRNEQIQVGDYVIDTNGFVGVISDVVRPNQVKVMFFDARFAHEEMRDSRTLTGETNCVTVGEFRNARSFCQNETVTDQNGFFGRILEAYSNGWTRVRFVDGAFNHEELRQAWQLRR